MIKRIILIILLLSLISITIASAQGDNLTIKIAVIGPGDELYFWWGHIALIIEDSITKTSFFYDYGLFSFDNENFFYNFAFGRLLYSCGVTTTKSNFDNYIKTNRDITIYTLDVPPDKKIEIREFANHNVLPENRDYFYHHFRDNCSTRIRDIIDIAVNGQFFAQYGNAPGRLTFRQHVKRHTWFSPAADWFLSFLMGQRIDTPVTVWEEMFLPAEVGRRIDEFWYTDNDNEGKKLVASAETVNRAVKRPVVLEIPRKQWPRELFFSVLLSSAFGLFIYLRKKNERAGLILSGISIGFCGLFFGITGSLLFFMSLFTNHDYSFNNTNIFFYTPLLLALIPLGAGFALTKDNDKRVTYDAFIRLIWLLTITGIFISMLIKLLPWFWQKNLTEQMLVLPVALVFTFNPDGIKEVSNRYLRGKFTGRYTE
jgi:hypothetical protein